MNPKVLIVDDEVLTCQLVAKILKLQGFASAILTDPTAIFEVIRQEAPALILMDYHLGASHGLDVLKKLKNAPDTDTLPVIMTSGMDYADEALAAGADGFLQKPFDWKALVALIKAKAPVA